jgi:hypothetical protein
MNIFPLLDLISSNKEKNVGNASSLGIVEHFNLQLEFPVWS